MHFGFSYTGLVFLLMLFVPNFLWTAHKPKDYEKYAANENVILSAMERTGEALVSALVLIFSDFNFHKENPRLVFLILAFALMVLYEIFWIRYFRSPKTMNDFYSSILGIPVAGATLPVLSVLLIAVYGANIPLLISSVILGIGHIGIHLNHRKEQK